MLRADSEAFLEGGRELLIVDFEAKILRKRMHGEGGPASSASIRCSCKNGSSEQACVSAQAVWVLH